MQPSTSYPYQPEHGLHNQPPHLVSHTHYCMMGDVTVADGVMVAPGVVLQASPGSRIVIAAGVCLAGGVCIQSRQGVLTIESGANLGANVLVVGHGTIAKNACISAGSTLVNPQIEANGLLPPNSLVDNTQVSNTQGNRSSQKTTSSSFRSTSTSGSTSRSNTPSTNTFNANGFVAANSGFTSGSYVSYPTSRPSSSHESDQVVNTFVEPPPIGPKAVETPDLSDQNGQYVDPSAPYPSVQSNGVQLNSQSNSSALARTNDRVYGKDQVSQLLSTLFPNRVT